MYLFLLLLLQVLFIPLVSAKCAKEDVIFTGDGKSFWIATVNGESKPKLLAPKQVPLLVETGKKAIEVTIKPACGAVKLLGVNLQTRNFDRIKVLGKEKNLKVKDLSWMKTSFTFKEDLVDEITIKVITDDYEAALRRIYVRACVVEAPKSLRQEIGEVFINIQRQWKLGNAQQVTDEYYTDDVIVIAQGRGLIRGKEGVSKYLSDLIISREFGEREIIDLGQLSETRAYTIFESRFYTDATKTEILPPIYRLMTLWKKENGKWLIDRLALTTDGSECKQN